MNNEYNIKLIECPRDAMQGWKRPPQTPPKEGLNMELLVFDDLIFIGINKISFCEFFS